MKKWIALWALCGIPCLAATISLTGSLDPNNANDIFIFSFVLSAPSDLTIQSFGYGGGTNAAGTLIPSGGFDTYLSLFVGNDSTAIFFASNDDGSCPPGNPTPACHDSTLSFPSLAAGDYMLALTVFDNFSFAENFGGGTLGDGFIGLGDYFDAASNSTRSSNYAVDVIGTGLAVPEPSSLSMLGSAILIALWRRLK
jgi:hypothetical protein